MRTIQQYTSSTDDTSAGPLSFLVLGDWGRDGDYNQSAVAEAVCILCCDCCCRSSSWCCCCFCSEFASTRMPLEGQWCDMPALLCHKTSFHESHCCVHSFHPFHPILPLPLIHPISSHIMPSSQMGRVADQIESSFVISTGDNFYDNGLADISDAQFETSFSRIYAAKSLHTQWYSGTIERPRNTPLFAFMPALAGLDPPSR